MTSTMSQLSGPFRVVEHVIPCQHIRDFPAATANKQEDTLHLAVKQYIPLDNLDPQPGDVTIIGTHANGYAKELYEPLWEEIHARSKSSGFRVRSIWIADVAQQGQSSVINEDLLGNDPSWYDHSRDLLHLINVKRDEMPRPVVGIGHSFGGAQLAQLCLMHPRLIHTLVLLDPAIQPHSTQFDGGTLLETGKQTMTKSTQFSTHRRDIWSSRAAAAESFKKSPAYKAWDPRVLDRWIRYGLRDLPTSIYPEVELGAEQKPVTLTTTRHQEVFTLSRPNYDGPPGKDVPFNRTTHPDLNPALPGSHPFYRSEPNLLFALMPHLRPSVLYMFAGKSGMSHPIALAQKLEITGLGVGGSGGVAEGRVQHTCFEESGHLIPLEMPGKCADEVVHWLGAELRRWMGDEDAFRANWDGIPRAHKLTVDERWLAHVPKPGKMGKQSKEMPPKARL